MLTFGRNQHNSVKQLSFNLKKSINLKKRKKKEKKKQMQFWNHEEVYIFALLPYLLT